MQPPEQAPPKGYPKAALVGGLIVLILIAGGIYLILRRPGPQIEVVEVQAPASVTLGDPVTVTVKVKNHGEKSGSKLLEVSFSGQVKRENVVLGPGEEKILSFHFVASSVGMQEVRADGVSERVWVAAPAPPPGMAGMVMTGTVGTPVSWRGLDSISASVKAPEKES